jgi:hypothetical protein
MVRQDQERQEIDKAEELVSSEVTEVSPEAGELDKAEKQAEAEAEKEEQVEEHEGTEEGV